MRIARLARRLEVNILLIEYHSTSDSSCFLLFAVLKITSNYMISCLTHFVIKLSLLSKSCRLSKMIVG